MDKPDIVNYLLNNPGTKPSQYLQNYPLQSQDLMNLVPVGSVGSVSTKYTPEMVKQAAKLLKGRIKPEDMQIMGRFAEMMDKGKGRGNLGQTGVDIQRIAEQIWGKQAANWSNKTINDALNMVNQRLFKGNY